MRINGCLGTSIACHGCFYQGQAGEIPFFAIGGTAGYSHAPARIRNK